MFGLIRPFRGIGSNLCIALAAAIVLATVFRPFSALADELPAATPSAEQNLDTEANEATEGSPDAAKSEADESFEMTEEIVYSTVGGRELLADAYVPKSPGPHPAILIVHGGAWRSGNRRQLRAYGKSLVKRGFVCFAIDYRLAPQHKFPAQIEDCRSAVKWIRANAKTYKVDASRLGAIGYSAGGHLVSLLGTTGEAATEANGNVDTRLQAVAAGGAPTDFRAFPDNGKWAKYLMGGDLDEVPERFQQASTAAFVDADDAPTFFFNGTEDSLVPIKWTRRCYKALKEAGVKTEMYEIQGAGHLRAAGDREALRRAYRFLATELQEVAGNGEGG